MIEFWSVEDTGWSGGTSWFMTGGSHMNPLRFLSFDRALEYAIARKKEFNQDTTKWRVVHTVIETSENKRVTTEEWREV
jgi:hypothetical protein